MSLYSVQILKKAESYDVNIFRSQKGRAVLEQLLLTAAIANDRLTYDDANRLWAGASLDAVSERLSPCFTPVLAAKARL